MRGVVLAKDKLAHFVRTELEGEAVSSRGHSIKQGLKRLTVPSKDYQVVSIGQDGNGTAMVFQWATREGFSFGDAFAY
jgi:hypothetical protein